MTPLRIFAAVILILLPKDLDFAETVKRFVDEDSFKSDPKLKKMIDSNNGEPVAPGYHSYMVFFVKKPDFDKKNDEPFLNTPSDFSVQGPCFASGTILSRRWALTRATPIAYYPIGSYSMVSQQSIIVPIEPDFMKLYEIDFVMIHPDHQRGDTKTDLALVRTAEELEFMFETRNVNLGFTGSPPTHDNCKLVVWSWFFQQDPDKKLESIDKGEISLNVKPEACSSEPDFTEHFLCLSQPETKHQPCGINSGAPVICDGVFAGVYIGNDGAVACNDQNPPETFTAIRVDNDFVSRWVAETTSAADLFDEDAPTDEEPPDKILKMCGRSDNLRTSLQQLLIVTIVLIM